MKCIAAVVMMAFVACSSASVAPLLYTAPLKLATPGITQYSSIPESTLIASHYAAPLAYHAPAIVRAAPLTYTAPFVRAAPLAYTSVLAAPRIIAAPAPVAYTAIPGEAKYTAINRGALHEAPLPGHTLSQTSLNLEPASK